MESCFDLRHLREAGHCLDPELVERVQTKRDQFRMTHRGFCSLQDKDVSIVFLKMINVRLPFLLKKGPISGGTGFKING